MNEEFIGALREIVKEKGISEEMLFSTIEDALVAAYKKNYATLSGSSQNVKVQTCTGIELVSLWPKHNALPLN